MFFDARAAKLLPPGQHLLVEGCPGLRLSATASTKAWTYRYKDDAGRMKQQRLGRWPAVPVQEAVRLWGELRDQRAQGVDPVAQRKAQRLQRAVVRVETCRDLLEDFIGGFLLTERKPEGAAAARSMLLALLDEEPAFARARPADVGRDVAFRLLDARRNFPAKAKKLRSLLGQAWERAHDAGKLAPDVPNWWRQVLHGRLKSKGKLVGGQHVGRKRRVLSQDELRVFLPWAAEHMKPAALDFALLYLYTGMRGVEIAGLKTDYITQEEDGWWVTFPAHLLKQERDADIVDHRVPLTPRALEIVQRRARDAWEGRLFYLTRGGVHRPYNRNTFSSYVYGIMPDNAKARRRQGVGLICPVVGWTAHDLRRTARTLLGLLDCPNEVGEAVIGHKPADLVGTYNLHTYDRQKRLWLTRLAARLDELYAGLPARP